MLVLAAALTPDRADDVCDGATRRLLESRFEVRWAGDDLGAGALAGLLDGAGVVLTSWGTPRLTAGLLAGCARPLVVAHAAGSVKNLLDPALLDGGVTVFSAAARIAWSVGEYCLGAILTLLRRLPQQDAALRAGRWKPDRLRGAELRGRRVGIVGASSTARALIALLAPFRPSITVYDPYLSPERAAELGVALGPLAAVVESDVVSVHVPNLPETEGMLSRELLARIPDGGIVVNSSRAPAVDHQALVNEVVGGRLLAALDVFAPEPPVLAPALATSDRVLLTPHIAGDTVQGHLALAGFVIDDALSWLDSGVRGVSYVDPARWAIAA